jgi:segregation and condensation protein B
MVGMIASRAALEAILFVAEEPIPTEELAEVLELAAGEINGLLEEYAADLRGREAGTVLRRIGGGWRLYSHPDAYPFLERFSATASARRISAASLEVLAVIAYRQPVSRGQVTEIRGVDSDSAIRTLERLGLIVESGRLQTPVNPVQYATTPLFLEKLGLGSLAELPPLADYVPPAGIVETLEETFRPPG